MQALRTYAAAVDRLNGWIGAVIRWLALAMVLIGAANAILRYLTRYMGIGLSPNWAYELQWYLFSVIFLMGAAYGMNSAAHVRVDILYARLSEKGRAWIEVLGTLLFLLPFSFLMLWVSYPAVMRSFAVRETSPDPGGLPRYPIKALILVSFGLLVLQGFAHIIKQIDVIRGTPAAPPAGGAGPSGSGEPSGAGAPTGAGA